MRIYDIRCLMLLCPKCLMSKTKKFSAFGALEKDYFVDKSINEARRQYKEEICKVVNEGNIQSEIELLNYFKPKKCNHFFHRDCLKETGKRGCMFCKYFLTEMNLVVFLKGNIDVKKLSAVFFRSQLVIDDNINQPLQENLFSSTLFVCVRNFLITEEMIDSQIRNRFKMKYEYESVKLDEDFKKIRDKQRMKKREKEKKKEEERKKRENEIKMSKTEQNYYEDDEPDNDYDYYRESENNYSITSPQKKTGFCNGEAKSVAVCKNCYVNKCLYAELQPKVEIIYT